MNTAEKLNLIRNRLPQRKIKIMILGLGSVGNYLLDYLVSSDDPDIEIVVAGRNKEKMQSDVNIVKVSSLIRRKNKTNVTVAEGLDLENIDSIHEILKTQEPDIIVNTSRVYSGLKYGSISWKNIRAYGIWTPLSIKYIRNIMLAYEQANCNAIVINTSYSDGTIPWLKSAGIAYPDFGSGNLNHLLPRIKFAIAAQYQIEDFWNIEVDLATAHFHDVVISKEGQTEGVRQLITVHYGGKKLEINQDEIFSKSVISMPVDQKRNMMNASSNFEIIECMLSAIRNHTKEKFLSPGAFGNIGGYPVILDGTEETIQAYIDEMHFSMADMQKKNRESIALDGIEDISDGTLIYTDHLLEKVKRVFHTDLPKKVPFKQIDETADFIIREIIHPALNQ